MPRRPNMDQHVARWARHGWTNKNGSPFRVPAHLLLPGECPCGAMQAEHTPTRGCETLRRERERVSKEGRYS